MISIYIYGEREKKKRKKERWGSWCIQHASIILMLCKEVNKKKSVWNLVLFSLLFLSLFFHQLNCLRIKIFDVYWENNDCQSD